MEVIDIKINILIEDLLEISNNVIGNNIVVQDLNINDTTVYKVLGEGKNEKQIVVEKIT